jgi:selenide,water dikinase
MGGTPKLALNILCYPEDLDGETIKSILQGGYDKVREADAVIAGGHTLKDNEPKYGLSVIGFVHPDQILTNSNSKAGDLLILTKPLGTGILNTAMKANLIKKETENAIISSMAELNKKAYQIMSNYKVNACTDITGFGILGHSYEMAASSGVTICLNTNSLPLHPEVRDMAKMGIIPAGAYTNRNFLEGKVKADPSVALELLDIMYDPQTSGGLLISIPEKDAYRLLNDLKAEIACSEIVGEVIPLDDYPIIVK